MQANVHTPVLCAIVAMTEKNWVMGKNNALPWHAPEDLKYFKETTMGCPIIMGRKTYDSIGRLLPKRWNIILSSQPKPEFAEGSAVSWCSNWEEAFAISQQKAVETSAKEVFVLGGSQIFEQCLPQIQRLYITWVGEEFDGDIRFPHVDLEREFVLKNERAGQGALPLNFCVYERKLNNK